MVLEALVAAPAEGILKKALSIAANEIAIAWGFADNLKIFHGKLEMIRAKLQDAERRNGTVAVTVWMKQLRDVVSEADDLLDEVQYEVLRHEVKKRDQKTKKLHFIPNLKKILFRREMGHKIEKINFKLSEVNKRALELGLQNEPQGPVPKSLHAETHSYLDEFKIVGREKDEQHIVELLTESNKEEKLTIVPVVGMGGIGKTTLAKSVYNNQKIKKHFDVTAWLCVSVKVNINRLLEMIYESLTSHKCELPTRENLITKLREVLGQKRYLLVLDDVRDEEWTYWADFRSCVINVNSQNGNGIVITTRNLEIGTNDMTKNSCTLKGLSDDEGWLMFKERAKPLPELEKIGHDIVKKCRGFPLLVKVIGSMLQQCGADKDVWVSVQQSEVWGAEEVGDMVLSTLKLSFESLPNLISKRCFAYCSIYEKDTVLDKKELIQLWMALGLLQGDDTRNIDMEDEGNGVFKILVSNSLFQDVDLDEYGYFYSCKMHDLVHDLSVHVSGDENSWSMVPPKNKDISSVKHLSLYQEKDSNLLKDMASKNLHTLFLRGVVTTISFQDFKRLRILKLSRTALTGIHDSVGVLVHLRVGREKGCQIEELGSLKHLGGKLRVSNLEEVGSKEEAIKADLIGKKNPYKIEFHWNTNEEGPGRNDKDILEGLQTPEKVKSLTIRNYSSDCFPEWVMNMSTNIGGEWIPLDNLVDIRLSGCRNVLSLPTVRNLPLLRDLELSDMDSLKSLSSSVGLGSSEPLSLSLRKLQLHGMKSLEKWTYAATNSSAMISPVLETLYIYDCPKIIVLDEHHRHPLVILEIWKCKNLKFIQCLQGLASLECLTIRNCDSLLGIPDLHYLGGSLKELVIYNCEKLTSIPRGIDRLTLLDHLTLGPFSKELDCFPSLKGIEKLKSNLWSFKLLGWSHWESIPEEVKHLESLEELYIKRFGIREIPIWLANMSSIKRFGFGQCPGLDADSVLKGAPREAKYVELNDERLR